VVEIDHAVDGSMLPHFLVKVELHKPRPAAIHRPDTADFASATALRRPGCRCRAGWASVGRRAMTMGVETTDRRHTKVGGRKKGTPKRATADIKARPGGNRRAGEACQARPKRAGARYSMPRPTRPRLRQSLAGVTVTSRSRRFIRIVTNPATVRRSIQGSPAGREWHS
jgi:hypothetical protein